MNFGEELKTAAIVGTAQKTADLPAIDGRLGETLLKLDRNDKERNLLVSAAVYSIWKNAGRAFEIDKNDAPEIAKAETREILSGRLKLIYETLIDSADKTLLPEFLDLMDRHGVILPPEILPLTLATVNLQLHFRGKDFRRKILPVVGERGKWLARQNADWRWVLVEETCEELFEAGKISERTFALEFLRNKDADKARELLQTVWKTEGAAERVKLLEVLRVNLSNSDEEFLDEIFRTDKSAEVKRTTLDLLANLPDTKLSKETTELFRPILSFKKKMLVKKELEIELPADWKEKTAALKTVGRQFLWDAKYLGEKSLALALGLSIIEPHVWEESLGLNAEEIVGLAYKNEWANALLAGFAMAALRFGNEQWFSAVLKLSSKSDLASSPFFVWSADSLKSILKGKIFPLICNHSNYVFADWFLENIKFESLETARFIEERKLSAISFTDVERNRGWRNLAFILPFSLIDKWLSELEKAKSQTHSNEYQIRLFDEVTEILNYRKEYITEFQK